MVHIVKIDEGHVNIFESRTAEYPLTRTGQPTEINQILSISKISRMVWACRSSTMRSVLARPMQMTLVRAKKYVTPYLYLLETYDQWTKDEGVAVNRDMFDFGYAIQGFNLAPSYEYINLIHHGNLRFEVKIVTSTAETYNCLVHTEFPARLYSRRQIHLSMNNLQIEGFFRENPGLSRYGMFSSDNLPEHVSTRPSADFCNTDLSNLPSRHWIVFCSKIRHCGPIQ